MRKMISFSLFVGIMLMMAALHSAQAQAVIVRSGPIVGSRAFYRPAYVYPRFRYGALIRPVPVAYYARPRFYRRPGIRVRVW